MVYKIITNQIPLERCFVCIHQLSEFLKTAALHYLQNSFKRVFLGLPTLLTEHLTLFTFLH